MNASSSELPQKSLGKEFVGSADSASLDSLEDHRGPLIVGDKRFLLKVGIFFTSLALVTFAWLVSNIGAFPPLVFLIVLTSFGMLVFFYRLFNAPHVLKLDSKGIDNRTQGFAGGFIPWEDLSDCRVVEADGRAMLGLVLKDQGRQRLDFLTLTLMDEHRRALNVDIILPPEVFGLGDPQRYSAFLNRFIDKADARDQLAES